MRAGAAILALVISDLALEAGLSLALANIGCAKPFAVLAGVCVGFFIVSHILTQSHVTFEFLRFAVLIVLGFDVAFGLDAFKECVVFFALIACIAGHIFVDNSILLHPIEQWNQR